MLTNRTALGTALATALMLLLGGCAKQGFPSGGPKDVTPPQALGCTPKNETRNFDRQQFYIEFDEYVVLKDADNNVLVSPPLKHKPEIRTKGKGVQVRLSDTLQANTTYLFQFKEAIADYTEGNPLPSFEYVFSTGEAMDTMMLAGQVLGARDGKPWKETLAVMAYREERCTDDTAGTHLQPDFVTRCDKEGWFAFHYIPAGRYRLVAVEDKDRNLRVGNSEAAAWDKRACAAVDSIDSSAAVRLSVSAPDRRQQRLLKADFTSKGHISIVSLLPLQAPRLDGEAVEWRLNSRRDTMTVWCLNAECDSTVLTIADSATGLQDTLKLKHRTRSRFRNLLQPSRQQQITPLCDGSKAFYDDLRLGFRNPVAKVREGAMAEVTHEKDSTTRLYPVTLDSSGITARIEATLTAGDRYSVRLRDSLFTDLYGNAYDSLQFTLTPKDYGILTLHIDNTTQSPLSIEVLDKRDTVVMQQALPAAAGTLKFIHLPEGEYRIRAVVDSNADGTWTPGDYRLQRQPEECILFEKTLQLREKWEMEERWRVESGRQKTDEGGL